MMKLHAIRTLKEKRGGWRGRWLGSSMSETIALPAPTQRVCAQRLLSVWSRAEGCWSGETIALPAPT